MTEKAMRAGAGAVGSGLVNHNQIPGLSYCKLHPVGKQVKWCAQWADHGSCLALTLGHPVADGDRVILADDLPKVSGCR